MDEIYKPNLHTPPHLFRPGAIYMVTASTLYRQPFLKPHSRKIVCNTLFEQCELLGWELQAWAVLVNHYHWIGQAPEDGCSLSTLIRRVHSISARLINQADRTPGRRIWYNYWDTCITNEKSYLARLHYVHINPVKHGLVKFAEDYPFCSYRWFEDSEDDNFKARVLGQPTDRIKVRDDF